MAGIIKINRIDVEAMKKEGLWKFPLIYKINALKEELETLPETSTFQRDSIQQKINKLEGIYNRRLEKIRAEKEKKDED